MDSVSRYTPDLVARYVRLGYWQPLTLAQAWDNNAVQYPDREAVADSSRRMSWRAAKPQIDRIASGLQKAGLKPRDLIVLQLPNSVELCLTRVACEKAGLLYLPVLRTLRDSDMEYILSFTRAKALVIRDEFHGFNYLKMVEAIRPRIPQPVMTFVSGNTTPSWAYSLSDMVNDSSGDSSSRQDAVDHEGKSFRASFICSTTGTTGFPKFVQYTTAARMAFSRGFIEALGLTASDTLAALSPAPSGPNVGVYFGAPQIPAKAVFLERFEAEEALKLLVRERVTVVCGVPAQMALILNHPRLAHFDLSSVRAWWSTGSELPHGTATEFERRTGVKVVNDYGAVDFGGIVAAGVEDSEDTRLLSVGKPRANTVIRLVDEAGQDVSGGQVGEVWGTGPSCSGGYFLDQEATAKAWNGEWFATGDLGRFDAKGNLVIVGRKKDMIIRGGWNIYPKEVEDLLLTHPAIADVAIVGMPDPIMGERLCAYIVTRAPRRLALNDVVSFLSGKGLPAYKSPDRIELIDRLPMVAEGQKADKKALRADITEKLRTERKI